VTSGHERASRTWDVPGLRRELVEFERALRDADLRDNSVRTYVDRAETFVRWLAGEYEPRGPID
jgi:hypothetical protein